MDGSELRLFFFVTALLCTIGGITVPLMSTQDIVGLEYPIGVVIASGFGLLGVEYWEDRRRRVEDAS